MKTYKEFMLECSQLNEGGLARQLSKAKTKTTGHISADRGSSESKNRTKRKGLEKDLKKKLNTGCEKWKGLRPAILQTG